MKITYDKKADAMYIYLAPKGKKITDTKELDAEWIADYAGNEIIGVEILNASKVLGAKLHPKTNFSAAIPHKIR